MGTWDVAAFGNDVAADFAAEVVADGGAAVVGDALAAVTGDGYLDRPEAAIALAAAELVAAAGGQPPATNGYNAEALAWARANAPALTTPELVHAARGAVDRADHQESELRWLWEEAGDADRWRAVLADLRRRLDAGSPPPA